MTALRARRTYQTIGALCESLSYHAFPYDERKRAALLFQLLSTVESIAEGTVSRLIETKQVVALLKTAKIESMSFRDFESLGILLSSALRNANEIDYTTADIIDRSENLVDAERNTP